MGARFCPACGTRAVPDAKFCVECGAPLHGGAAPGTRRPDWQFSTVGAGVLAAFLVAGLTMWVVILSPRTPVPGPGGGAPRGAQTAAAGGGAGALPENHPEVPRELPDEVKKFIADFAAKAKDSPRDADTWMKLAQVNARAAQIDPSYAKDAVAAYRQVLDIQPDQPDALRGLANVYYDRNEPKEAIPYYERYLKQRPDDASARTDLGTMQLYAGDEAKAIATYQEVVRQNPSFLQAHYNLAVTYHRRGDDQAALAELRIARGLASEEPVRRQIDEMIAALGGPAPEAGPAAGDGRGKPGGTPFQRKVEEDIRAHPILGPRVVRVEWSGPGAGRVVVRNFPMDGMPPEVREKFRGRMAEQLRTALAAAPVEEAVRLEIADVGTGRVMETVVP